MVIFNTPILLEIRHKFSINRQKQFSINDFFNTIKLYYFKLLRPLQI